MPTLTNTTHRNTAAVTIARVITLHQQGVDRGAIAERMGITRVHVSKCIKQWLDEREGNHAR